MRFIYIIIILVASGSVNLPAQVNGAMYNTFLKGIYNKETPTISCNELYDDYEDFTVIDTRSIEEFEISHLKNALFINFDNYLVQDLSKIPNAKPIVFYCSVGWRSQKVTEHFMANGFANVYNLYGGVFDWSNKELPLYKKDIQTDSVHVYSKKWGYWLKNGHKVY